MKMMMEAVAMVALCPPPSLSAPLTQPLPTSTSSTICRARMTTCSPLSSLISCPPARLQRQMRKSTISNKRLPSCIRAAAAAAAITFHIENTSVTVPFSQVAARGLSKSIGELLNTFKEKDKAERPRRWESMEYRHSEDGVFVEFFCNPNAYANAFQAKVLITVSDEKMKITSEGQLSAIKADIDQYVEAYV